MDKINNTSIWKKMTQVESIPDFNDNKNFEVDRTLSTNSRLVQLLLKNLMTLEDIISRSTECTVTVGDISYTFISSLIYVVIVIFIL